MTMAFVPIICSVQIAALLAFVAHDAFVRRVQIIRAWRHRGWLASPLRRAPMLREPAFADGNGALVYLLPARDPAINVASVRRAA